MLILYLNCRSVIELVVNSRIYWLKSNYNGLSRTRKSLHVISWEKLRTETGVYKVINDQISVMNLCTRGVQSRFPTRPTADESDCVYVIEQWCRMTHALAELPEFLTIASLQRLKMEALIPKSRRLWSAFCDEVFECTEYRADRNPSSASPGLWVDIIRKKKVHRWCRQFRVGRRQVHDEKRSGRPSIITNDLVELVREWIMENCRLTITELSSHFPQISRSLLHKIATEHHLLLLPLLPYLCHYRSDRGLPRIRFLYLSLSPARLRSWPSVFPLLAATCLITSSHVVLGLPIGRFPCGLNSKNWRGFRCSSILVTCPNQLSCRSSILLLMGGSCKSSRIFSFLILFLSVFPAVVQKIVRQVDAKTTDTRTQSKAHGVGIYNSAGISRWRDGTSQVMKRVLHTLPQKPSSSQCTGFTVDLPTIRNSSRLCRHGKWCTQCSITDSGFSSTTRAQYKNIQ